MDARVKHKARESTTIIAAAKFEDDLKKNMKKPVVSIIGQEADDVEDTCNNRELTTKILELEDVSRQTSSDQTSWEYDDSKKDLKSSSSSSLEMINKLENDENTTQKTENIKKEEEKTKEKEGNEIIIGNMMKNNKKTTTIPHVWDCGSTLYDSFELNSFKRQLDSAISASSARTMSMSHIPNRSLPLALSPEHTYTPPLETSSSSSNSSGGKKQSNKISRSLQRLLKSVFFRPKNPKSLSSRSTPTSPVYNYDKAAGQRGDKDRYYVVYDKTGSLTTIPESTSEKEVVSPEINSLVRKTVSERFPASRVVGISCA